MIRRSFIKTNLIGLAGLSLSSFSAFQSEFSIAELMGKSNPKLYGNDYKLKKEAHEAFLKMKTQATTEGITIKVVSSYRSYEHQNRIWNHKYKKFTSKGLQPIEVIKKIVEYSTIPGTSRHHWGTDIDIIDATPKQPKEVLLEKNFNSDGSFCKLKKWMDKNAEKFGFYLVYTDNKNRKGFKYEPWHYSYAPISIAMLTSFRKLNLSKELLNMKLTGSKHITESFINQYINNNILDINPFLK